MVLAGVLNRRPHRLALISALDDEVGVSVQAGDISLGKVFANDHQNFIPLFQRPYVWDKESNWAPLWEDIRTAAEEVEKEQSSGSEVQDSRTYFLGAIVSQARKPLPRRLSSSNVIDGQQRLTTLQTLLSAARRVAAKHASPATVGRFTSLLENRAETIHTAHPEDRYKVWPLPQDNAAFRWVLRPLDEDTQSDGPDHRIVQASLWFETNIEMWASESDDPELRMENLFTTLRDRMQLVQILLDPTDDPQVIFEALNHRGVPLDAADLVKNLLFQAVDDQGDHARADELLMTGWLPLDDKPWRDAITTGRLKRSRVDILLSYWLTIRSRREVIVDHLFADFKAWMTSSKSVAADVIFDVRRYADKFLEIQRMPDSDPVSLLLDRMNSTSTTTPWPIILYLYTKAEVPQEQKQRAVKAIDSFLMRRGMCRLPTGDYNRVFLQVLTAAIDSPPGLAGHAVEASLASQTADSRRWPGDEEFLRALDSSALYTSVHRPRLKCFLVGLENHLRTGKTEPGPLLSATERKLNIEHILPQSWEEHWPLPEGSDDGRLLLRTSSVHKLGNLTLLTSKLNPSVSNKSWDNKKSEIRQHSFLRLTTGTVLSVPAAVGIDEETWVKEWNEERIQIRGNLLSRTALEVWISPPDVTPTGLTSTLMAPSQPMAEPARPKTDHAADAAQQVVVDTDLGGLHEAHEETQAYRQPCFTQPITQVDFETGRIRIPSRAKHLFPAERATLRVDIEDVEVEAYWDPRTGPDRERSGILRIGRSILGGIVFVGKPLLITTFADGDLAFISTPDGASMSSG